MSEHSANGSRRQLLVNADGYGFTAGVNRGIEETIEFGLVKSISVNSNFDSVEPLRQLVQRYPWVSVGVHLNPVVGRPLADPADIPTLVNEHGDFHYQSFVPLLRAGRIDPAELEHELGLQIQRVQDLGAHVTHLDSHQNTHLWPAFFTTFLTLAHTHNIPRMRTHDQRICMEHDHRLPAAMAFYATHPKRAASHTYFRVLMRRARAQGMRMCDRLLSVGLWGQKAQKAKLDVWTQILRKCPGGKSEIYIHPGYVDDDLRRWAKVIVDQREDERRVLTDPRLRTALEASGAQVISFYDV